MVLSNLLQKEVHIDWQFITHEEREDLVERAEEILVSQLKLKDQQPINFDGDVEYNYEAYIQAVKAYIMITSNERIDD